MTTADDRRPTLEWTGERYVPQVSGNIRLEHLHRYLLARELSKGQRVLDIASGEGYGSDLLAEVAEYVVGVDIAHEVVRHARIQNAVGYFRYGMRLLKAGETPAAADR